VRCDVMQYDRCVQMFCEMTLCDVMSCSMTDVYRCFVDDPVRCDVMQYDRCVHMFCEMTLCDAM